MVEVERKKRMREIEEEIKKIEKEIEEILSELPRPKGRSFRR
jgi:hypothetical protein